MKKTLPLFFIILMTSICSVHAQKGNNQISVAADMGLPIGQFDNSFNTGFGGYLKGLYGTGKIGQVTLTAGYGYYKSKGDLSIFHANSTMIPILAGYRLGKNGFYVEPQLGYGLYRLKVNYNGETPSETDGAFTYALGAGFTFHGIDAGVRYLGARKGSDDITIIGVHVGYTFSFKK